MFHIAGLRQHPCINIGHSLGLGHVTMVCAVCLLMFHYGDVIMGVMASQITSLTIVYSAVYSCVDQRKHQSSASLACVRGIHRWPVNSPRKRPVTRKMFPFDDVIMLKIHVNLDVLTWPLIRWCLLCQRTKRRGFYQYKYVVSPSMNFHFEVKTVIAKIWKSSSTSGPWNWKKTCFHDFRILRIFMSGFRGIPRWSTAS